MEHKNIEQKLEKEFSNFLKCSYKLLEYKPHASKPTYDKFFEDKLLVIDIINFGIPYSLFDTIKQFAPFSDSDWAKFLNISVKSLQRYRQSSRHFQFAESEKIMELTELIKTGLEVFGDLDKFKLWLETPNFALGKSKPIELIKTSYGRELVLNELIRIDHGILA